MFIYLFIYFSSDSSSSQALTAQSQTFLRPDTPNNASGAGTFIV